MASSSSNPSNSPAQLQAADAQASAIIRQVGRPVFQSMVAPITLDGRNLGKTSLQARMSPRMSGLLRSILVRVEVDIKVPVGTTLARSPYSVMNLCDNVQFTDLNNNKRIDTSGVHLALLESVRCRQPVGAAFFTDSDLPLGNEIGGSIMAPTVTSSSSGGNVTAVMTYKVPVSYGPGDFRGAMYMSTTQATATLQVSINPNMFSKIGDPNFDVDSVYQWTGTTAPTCGDIRIITHQDYIDQIPMQNNAVVLPTLSMGQIYQLIGTSQSGIVPNSDFRVELGNLRTYMSVMTRFKNGSAYNKSDLNSVRLEAANMYRFFEADPITLSYRNRMALGFDLPAGSQYMPFRAQPVNTTMWGNLAVLLNAKTAADNSRVDVFSEFFANTLTAGATTIGS